MTTESSNKVPILRESRKGFMDDVNLYVLGTKKEDQYLLGPRIAAQLLPEAKRCCLQIPPAKLTAEDGWKAIEATLRLGEYGREPQR